MNYDPLKEIFAEVYANAQAEFPTFPQLWPIDFIMRNPSGKRPYVSVNL